MRTTSKGRSQMMNQKLVWGLRPLLAILVWIYLFCIWLFMDSSCLYLLSTDRLVLVWSGWRRAEWGVRSGPGHNTTGPEFSRKATPPSPPSPGQGNLFQRHHTTHYYAILGGGWASGHAGQGHSSPQGFTCHKSQGDSDSDKGLI